LVRGFGQRQAAAQGLALALVAPGSVIALATYARADQVNWSLGAPLALGGLSTISWGVACARRLPERVLRAVFVGFLLVTAGLMWPLS
ncbi:sulfite exporter TauE/SafE family protein, partial [Rivihabitans pingtungensis]|uniref:sulfite exporter TauE/SafE family protein n=1 Tax=Rivihabitans pingtungensis TaxID=1054498 RepID=UPI0028969768